MLRNGTPYREQTITAQDNWKFEFNDLLKQDNNLEDYVYSVREKNTPTNYISSVGNDLSYFDGTSIKFGNIFATESTSYDWVSIYYADENNNIRMLKGQGSQDGKWGGRGTSNVNTLAGKTIIVPSKDVYIYWRSDSSSTDYGFDVVSMDLIHIDDNSSITSSTATLPTTRPIENSETLPATSHNYSDNEAKMWHYLMGSGNFAVITNKQASKSISGQKIWSDNSPTTRPNSITVNLLQNGTLYQSKNVTASNNWQYEFNNIPVFDDNDELYHYTISENEVNGYITRYSNGTETVETPTEGYNDIENIWNPRNITITKRWTSSKNVDDSDFRPENITVHLRRKQNILQRFGNLLRTQSIDNKNTLEIEYETDNTKWTKDGNTWTYTFSIPANDYDWEVYEDELEFYNESNLENNPADVTSNAVTITNDFEPVVEISGEKHWPENDAEYRPDTITVSLHRNGQVIDSKVVPMHKNEVSGQAYAMLDKTKGELVFYRDVAGAHTNGQEVDNKVYYTNIENLNITSYNSQPWLPYYDLIKTVRFEDVIRPINTAYWFYRLDYCTKFENLNYLDTSNVTSMERMFTNCKMTELDLSSFDTSNVTNMKEMFYSCTRLENIYVSESWNVDNVTSSSDMFKSCTKLPNFSSSAVTKTNANYGGASSYLTYRSPYGYSFGYQDEYDDSGNRYTYSVSENEQSDYIARAGEEQYDIVNILNRKTISGTKTWIGDTPEDRPDSITVNLYQDNRKIDSKTTTADRNWSYSFEDVPIYKSDGVTEYEYRVEEEPVENYFTDYDRSHAGVKLTFSFKRRDKVCTKN